MNREEAKEEVKSRLEEYLRAKGIDTSRKFRCLNPAHADEHPSMSYDPQRQIAHCFSCNVSYDTFNVMEQDTGLHGLELFKYAYEYFGINLEGRSSMSSYKFQEKNQKLQSVSDYMENSQKALKGSQGEKYLHERGFDDKTLQDCQVGYDESKKAIVLPYMKEEGYYITRSIEGKEYRKPQGKREPLYELGEKTRLCM